MFAFRLQVVVISIESDFIQIILEDIFIHRLCSLTLTRLVVVKSLGADLTSIVIAVKIQVK